MARLLNIVTPLHKSTARKYLERMVDDKIQCMLKAKEYGYDYWDGDRRYGYGGYKYIPGRWTPAAQAFIDTYRLKPGSRVLDVGCGKAFLLYEMKQLIPGLEVRGFDISQYGLDQAKPEIRDYLFPHRAQDPYPFDDKYFDLVISLGCLHNIRLTDLQMVLSEIERVGRRGYIMVESYRNEQELFNLQCWALTCESFFDAEEWVWVFDHFGYTGDYEFIYFE